MIDFESLHFIFELPWRENCGFHFEMKMEAYQELFVGFVYPVWLCNIKKNWLQNIQLKSNLAKWTKKVRSAEVIIDYEGQK